MLWTAAPLATIFVCWWLLQLRTTRPDGTLLRDVQPYRRVLNHISNAPHDSWVLYDSYVNAEPLLAYVADSKRHTAAGAAPVEHCDVIHCVIAAAGIALHATPELNRFVAGRRLYQRSSCAISFATKRKRMDPGSLLATIKLELPRAQPFAELCRRINDAIAHERSDAVTEQDKKLALLLKLPHALLGLSVWLARWADRHNLVARAAIESDPLFASLIITSLGSLGMPAAYHHLFEWGNCPLLLVIGKIEPRPVVVDGRVAVQQQLHLRFTYDERIDDGLTAGQGLRKLVEVLESPQRFLDATVAPG
jgi:hypothetical protein